MNPHLQKLMAPGTEFSIDGPAMACYWALVDELHASNIQIIYVIPPVLESIYLSKAGAFANYSHTVMENKREGDRVIDFTSDEFVDFRSNPGNFKDGVHLTNQSAQEVVAIINDRVNQWIQNSWLMQEEGRPSRPPLSAMLRRAALLLLPNRPAHGAQDRKSDSPRAKEDGCVSAQLTWWALETRPRQGR
jgi:hypothetical protein